MADRTPSVCIITARGGSKRIPRKNIKPFCGRPIIAYSIDAALEAGVFDEVMVSTDDAEIADVARAAGAVVPFMRSAEASSDHATTADALREVIEAYGETGRSFDSLCCLYPTAPFVAAELLRRGMAMLDEHDADCVLPVVAFSYPVQRSLLRTDDGRVVMAWPEHYPARSQDLETHYHDSGQFYCMKTQSLLSQMKLFAQRTYPIVISQLDVQDIDNDQDWVLAEAKYRLRRGG